jgi:hypothetical protein
MYFIFGDGDQIGRHLKRLLYSGDLGQASYFSRSVQSAISDLSTVAASSMEAQVIYAGGDDILLTVSKSHFNQAVIMQLAAQFEKSTGCTISFGVADNIDAAIHSLDKAKALGKRIVIADHHGK